MQNRRADGNAASLYIFFYVFHNEIFKNFEYSKYPNSPLFYRNIYYFYIVACTPH